MTKPVVCVQLAFCAQILYVLRADIVRSVRRYCTFCAQILYVLRAKDGDLLAFRYVSFFYLDLTQDIT
jgi:hypothetical protein